MGEITITGWRTRDVRFPTSLDGTGSDAMNAAGNYSSAYCILETDSEYTGHGMVSDPILLQNISIVANYPCRPSPSAVETTSSAQLSTTSPSVSRAGPSPPSSQTGARPGDISSTTVSSDGSAPRRVSSTSLSVPSSTLSGIFGPRPSTSPSGVSLPT
jgi:hypothetical protein